jgi:hypothetical protein
MHKIVLLNKVGKLESMPEYSQCPPLSIAQLCGTECYLLNDFVQ